MIIDFRIETLEGMLKTTTYDRVKEFALHIYASEQLNDNYFYFLNLRYLLRKKPIEILMDSSWSIFSRKLIILWHLI